MIPSQTKRRNSGVVHVDQKEEMIVADRETNERNVRTFLDAFHASRNPDFADLTQRFFAEAAQYQPLVPMRAPAQTRDGVRDELERQYEFYSDCKCVIHRVGAGDDCVFTERTDTVTLNQDGREIETRLNAVFDMDADGKILFWREYYDAGDLVMKIGVTLEQFEQIMAAR